MELGKRNEAFAPGLKTEKRKEPNMNFRRFQGWVLVIYALFGLLDLLPGDIPFFRILFIIGALLFIVGVPAIQSVQPMGTAGLVGIIMLELAAVISLGVNLLFLTGRVLFLPSGVGDAIFFISALAGALGRVIVGWLTTRQGIFPAWVGWAFFLQGLLHLIRLFLIGLFDLRTLVSVIGIIALLLGSAVLFGYGFGIARRAS